MPERGFKIAQGFVEVRGEIDEQQIRRTASRAGEDAGDHFTKAMGRRLGRDLHKEFGTAITRSRLVPEMGSFVERNLGRRLGRTASKGLLDGLVEGLLTPNRGVLQAMRTGVAGWMASPMGLAGLAAGGLFVASFVSAVISSAVLGGLGIAIAGAAAFALRNDPQLGAAMTELGDRVDKVFSNSARGLVRPFLLSIDMIGDRFEDRLGPRFQRIFDGIAPAILPLTEGLLNAADKFLAGTERNIGSLAQDFLVPLSRELPRLGEMAGNFVDTLVRNAPTIAAAFRHIVDNTVFMVDALDDTLIILTSLFTGFDKLIDVTAPLIALWREMSVESGGATSVMEDMFILFGGATALLAGWGSESGEATDATAQLQEALAEMGTELLNSTGVIDVANLSMSELVSTAGSLRNAIELLIGGDLAMRAANRQLEDSYDRLRESVQEHGTTLNTNTEAGRRNEKMIDDIIDASITAAQAVYDHVKATEGEEAAIRAANGVLGIQRGKLREVLTQLGFNEEAIDRYIEALAAIPDRVRTTVETNFINTGTPPARGYRPNRYGNVYMAQDGLVNLGSSRMFPSGGRTLFGFREPGTGGEAFVARNAPRDRSLAILAEAARWHRAMVTPLEHTATALASAPAGGAQVHPMFNVRVYVGDQELRDVVRVEVEQVQGEHDRTLANLVHTGIGGSR